MIGEPDLNLAVKITFSSFFYSVFSKYHNKRIQLRVLKFQVSWLSMWDKNIKTSKNNIITLNIINYLLSVALYSNL